MTASERAEFLTDLFAQRSRCAASIVQANREHWLSVGTFLESARDSLSAAIEALQDQAPKASRPPRPCPACRGCGVNSDLDPCPDCMQ